MQHHGAISNITYPGSVYRLFKYRREYPTLPDNYDWETQKQRYCPRGLTADSDLWKPASRNKFGYVFCHRGLYERASRFIDNSNSAIENGIRQGFFLHEMDAFIWRNLGDGFLAHDHTADRVTSKDGLWASYPLREILETNLVARGVELETPDFGSSYLETNDQIPDLESSLWKERVRPTGRTLLIDLRGTDFAKGIAHFAFHISKRTYSSGCYRLAEPRESLAWSIFRSTMLKGYNLHFVSFDHLLQAIKKESAKAYPSSSFRLEYLQQLPPLIIVIYSNPVVDLARNTPPKNPLTKKLSYEHIYEVFKENISSFIGIGPESYNFILEITHSGLGLLYDVETGEARNPLTGDPLEDADVIFDSLVDRAMIDVSLELRRNNPNLLFSSCTRLPDVIISNQRYKAHHATGKLMPWEQGERGLAAQLRAIHGGLYPQSDVVVADNPIAEIAARTWIDQNSTLDRSELLRIPYYKWLKQAGDNVYNAVMGLNGDFLPNKIGDPIDATLAIPDANDLYHGSPIDSSETVRSWLEGLQFTPPDDVPDPSDQNKQSENVESEDGKDEEVGEVSSTLPNVEHASGRTPSKISANIAKIFFGDDVDRTRTEFIIKDMKFVFYRSPADQRRVACNIIAYKAAYHGKEEALKKLISKGTDTNTSVGLFGNALGAACARNHVKIARLLLDNGADVNDSGASISPLQIASRYGHDATVELLLDRGADVNASNGVYGTALSTACRAGHDSIVRLLLAKGADVNISGIFSSPLHIASEYGHSIIVELLLNNGAEVNALSKHNQSALGEACKRGHVAIIQRLLAAGADVHVPIRGTFSTEISLILKNAGASVVAKTEHGPEYSLSKSIGERTSQKGMCRKKKKRFEDKQKALKRWCRDEYQTPFLPLRSNCGCFLCQMDLLVHERVCNPSGLRKFPFQTRGKNREIDVEYMYERYGIYIR